ncbi:MAG: alpha-L-fucosidase [Phycisphaerae bacterium]
MHQPTRQAAAVPDVADVAPADWTALDARPVPAWFTEAGFGVFVHWGPYSVPAWAPRRQDVEHTGQAYAEWYWHFLDQAGSPTRRFHDRHHPGRDYASFADGFTAELYDPDAWAELFAAAGARYVVVTARHHDGYCLWPSAQSPGWNSTDRGPGRDLVAPLADAVRARGMRFGLYYSLLQWHHPDCTPERIDRFVSRHMHPQLQDLVLRYRPDLIFTDGEWLTDAEGWQSRRFLTWLFEHSPVKDHVAVNDRWGKGTRSKHGGYWTTEYGEIDASGKKLAAGHRRKWEECRSIGFSFGLNRNEHLSDFMTPRQLADLRLDLNARGGNLLLNVGPGADGRIPWLMQDRLLAMNALLRTEEDAR